MTGALHPAELRAVFAAFPTAVCKHAPGRVVIKGGVTPAEVATASAPTRPGGRRENSASTTGATGSGPDRLAGRPLTWPDKAVVTGK